MRARKRISDAGAGVGQQNSGYRAVGRKGLMIAALLVLLTEVLAVVIGNSLGHGLHLEWTISRYVGLETWSAVVFALGNLVVMLLMLYYLYGMGESWQMGRGFYVLVVAVVVALIGLSACPLGYFDTATGVSSVSYLHQICSRTMFAAMLFLTLVTLASGRTARKTRVVAGMFAIYGVICAGAFLIEMGWFVRSGLVFETLYLLGFMGWCLMGQTRPELLGKESKKGER